MYLGGTLSWLLQEQQLCCENLAAYKDSDPLLTGDDTNLANEASLSHDSELITQSTKAHLGDLRSAFLQRAVSSDRLRTCWEKQRWQGHNGDTQRETAKPSERQPRASKEEPCVLLNHTVALRSTEGDQSL